MSRRVVAIVAAALLLAIGMAGLGFLASRTLRERDRAVRDGVLLALAQEIEVELRAVGPDGADDAIAAFLGRHIDSVAGFELVTPAGIVARGGTLAGEPSEDVASLGPAWRGIASGSEGNPSRGRGSPPFTFRLYPSKALGGHGAMAGAILTVSSAAAAALFVLALLAARGLDERERRLEAEAEQQRLEVAAMAGAGLAHRIRTPLATIKGTAQLLESQQMFSAERARRIVDEAVRIDGMIKRLLEFARPPEPQPETFNAAQVARELAARIGSVTVTSPETLLASADPVHYETALEELLVNARAFDSGPLAITVTSRGGAVVTEVRDHGPGLSIDPERATAPYVTTRADGTGLGLAIVQTLMRANGGGLELRNADGGGCIAALRIPEAS